MDWKKKQEANAQRTGFFSSLATEKFLFVSFLFCSQRDCHSFAYTLTLIHTHTPSRWSEYPWVCVKRKQISTGFARLLFERLWFEHRQEMLNRGKTEKGKHKIKYLSSLKWLGRTCFADSRVIVNKSLFFIVKEKLLKWREENIERKKEFCGKI